MSKNVKSGGNLLAVEIVAYANHRGANSSQRRGVRWYSLERKTDQVSFSDWEKQGWRAQLEC